MCASVRVCVCKSTAKLCTLVPISSTRILCFCCTISLSHYYTAAAAAFGWRFYWWFTYQGIRHIYNALDCFISLFCSQHLFAKLISVPFLSLTFFQVRVTIIMSSACMHVPELVPCASAYKLCVRWYAEQSYRLFYGTFYTQSQGVMCVCRKSFAITPAGFFITSVSFSFPRHFRNYVCFIVCANYMHSWSTHSILFGRYTNSKCFHLICPACDIHFDFSYFTAIQHINRTEERFQDRILT